MEEIDTIDWEKAINLSHHALQEILKSSEGVANLDIAASFLMEGPNKLQHCGVLIHNGEIVFKQAQLHHSPRYESQLELGDKLGVVDRPYGRLSIILGDDNIYPETYRMASTQGVNLIAAPGHIMEDGKSRPAFPKDLQKTVCFAYASRGNASGASLLANLHEDFTY